MRTRFLVKTSLIAMALLLGLAQSPGLAQVGTSQPTLLRPAGAHPFPTRAVWPHEMMTFQERHDTWLKMREARSSAERYDIWAKKIAELEKRAGEHGLALRDHGPMMMAQDEQQAGWRDPAPRWGGYGPEQPMTQGGWRVPSAYGPGPAYGSGPAYGPGPYGPERPAAPSGWSAPHQGAGGHGGYGGGHPFAPIGR